MKVAGIDYGEVRIGVAISDPERLIAFPLQTYVRSTPERDAEFFLSLVKDEQISQFVIGIPLHLSGDESEESAEVLLFGSWLGNLTGLKIDYFDERFTSVEAEKILRKAKLTDKKRKERRDMIAAQLILSAYLEAGCQGISDYYDIND
ncbi:MAG: Holliday junction resolvase RuvX [Planctomycetaceae bacterium]|jgi:putative Holliday junction resolvase|nr:Holliday junction resolvase RuvX [Planctomycetaceae bacterium]